MKCIELKNIKTCKGNEKIIEINVTSPCYFIKEVNGHFNCHLEKKINDFILSKLYSKVC